MGLLEQHGRNDLNWQRLWGDCNISPKIVIRCCSAYLGSKNKRRRNHIFRSNHTSAKVRKEKDEGEVLLCCIPTSDEHITSNGAEAGEMVV